MDLVTILSGPVGMIGLVILGAFAPKLYAVVGPALAAVLAKLKPTQPAPAPMPDPNTPVPPPGPPPVLPPTGRPLIDAALKILLGIAQRKFPTLTPAEAFERHLVSEASHAAYMEDQQAAPPAEKK